MSQTSRDNWLQWSYDNIQFGSKVSPRSKFSLDFKKIILRPVKSYYDELFENAKITRDIFTGKFNLLLSGGIDSEIVLRVYHQLKIPVEVYIFKYEKNYNYRDVNQAIQICNALGIDYNLIDFNLEKFFENDAYDIFKKVYCHSSGRLPQMKMTEYLDGIPIYGSGEPYCKRASSNWSKKSDWVIDMGEGARCWAVYHKSINRTAICDWYEFSPELLVSYFNIDLIKELMSDSIQGKLSSNSSKIPIHQKLWQDITLRPKLVGFEGINEPGTKPPFMLEFEKEFITDKVDTADIYMSKKFLFDLIC
jgi:hypothetical protein